MDNRESDPGPTWAYVTESKNWMPVPHVNDRMNLPLFQTRRRRRVDNHEWLLTSSNEPFSAIIHPLHPV